MLNTLIAVLNRVHFAAALKKAARTGLVATAVLFIPGLLGWLHDLTAWANSHGQTPLPDGHNLIWLAISATTAGLIAAGNFLLLALEDISGKGILRTPATTAVKVHVDAESLNRGIQETHKSVKHLHAGLDAIQKQAPPKRRP